MLSSRFSHVSRSSPRTPRGIDLVGRRVRTGLGALATLALLLAPAAAQHLPAPGTFVGDFFPRAVVVGDFDEDGKPDALVALDTAASVGVLLADDACGFRPPALHAAGLSPRDLAVADLDQDGHLDAVVANTTTDQVTVLFGDGGGGFPSSAVFAVGDFPEALVIADVTGDTRLDIITADLNDRTLTVLAGNGLGGFQQVAQLAVAIDPRDLRAADLDEDGTLDLVAISSWFPGSLTVWISDGGGGFSGGASFKADGGSFGGYAARTLDVADMDGDGHLDLLATGGETNGTWWHRGDGGGSFESPVALTTEQPRRIATADLDDDGVLDLVTGVPGGATTWLGAGGGTASLPQAARWYSIDDTVDLTVADVNVDGREDLLMVGARHLTLLLGDGAGGFLQRPGQDLTDQGAWFDRTTFADLDDDGQLDLITANVYQDDMTVLRGDGAGGFTAWGNHPVGVEPLETVAADVDEDGQLDLLVAAGIGVWVLLGDGAGGFSPGVEYPGTGCCGVALAVADVDEDGHLDVLLAGDLFSDLVLLRGVGDGTFAPAELLFDVPFPGAVTVHLPDLDLDGHLDLVLGIHAGAKVFVFLGDGTGAFTEQDPLQPPSDTVRHVDVGLIDGDLLPDIALAHLDGITVFLGDGAGGFSSAGTVSSFLAVRVHVADISLDGHADLLSTRGAFSTGGVALSLGDGTGAFAGTSVHAAGGFVRNFDVFDLSGDGVPDVVVTGTNNRPTVAVLDNLAGPTIDCGAGKPGVAGMPHLAVTGSLNGGELVTLALADAAPSSLAWLVSGAGTLFAPLKGGTLVPGPDAVLGPIPVSAAGTLVLPGPFPLGLPPGFPLAMQFWIADPAASAGFVASNGVVGLLP